MPTNTKPALYGLRKALPVPLTTTYAQYTTDQLRAELRDNGVDIEASLAANAEPGPEPEPTPVQSQQAGPDLNALFEAMNNPPEDSEEPRKSPPVAAKDPNELPAQRLNTHYDWEPLRTDENGMVWYQEEVRKPAYPKPRGRRVLKYMERGVETQTVQTGEYVETFEVAGEGIARPAEIKITLPSFQVGLYRHPSYPFMIHCYDGREGFDLFEVEQFYGGPEMVPATVKRVYIENDLCYDIRSVIRAIQEEHRQLQLTGRLP